MHGQCHRHDSGHQPTSYSCSCKGLTNKRNCYQRAKLTSHPVVNAHQSFVANMSIEWPGNFSEVYELQLTSIIALMIFIDYFSTYQFKFISCFRLRCTYPYDLHAYQVLVTVLHVVQVSVKLVLVIASKHVGKQHCALLRAIASRLEEQRQRTAVRSRLSAHKNNSTPSSTEWLQSPLISISWAPKQRERTRAGLLGATRGSGAMVYATWPRIVLLHEQGKCRVQWSHAHGHLQPSHGEGGR